MFENAEVEELTERQGLEAITAERVAVADDSPALSGFLWIMTAGPRIKHSSALSLTDPPLYPLFLRDHPGLGATLRRGELPGRREPRLSLSGRIYEHDNGRDSKS